MNEDKPEVGDYVICYYDNDNIAGYSDVEQDFIQNKIGKVVEIDSRALYQYSVTFDNIPEQLINGDIDGEAYIDFNRDAIKSFSNDKEDLEEELELRYSANKFNI